MIQALGFAVLLAAPVAAQEVRECDRPAGARNPVEPCADCSRTSANGKTRLAVSDTVEAPAAGAFFLPVLYPLYAELGDRQRRVIQHDGIGFRDMDCPERVIDHNPATGFAVAVVFGIDDGETYLEHSLTVTSEQSRDELAEVVFK